MKMVPMDKFRRRVKKTDTEELKRKLNNYSRDVILDKYSAVIRKELEERGEL